MLRRPPRSTRTDTLFLYTTLFRRSRPRSRRFLRRRPAPRPAPPPARQATRRTPAGSKRVRSALHEFPLSSSLIAPLPPLAQGMTPVTLLNKAIRPEERRVGKEWLRTCRSRGSPYH